jgi:hypothetical protein
MAIGDCEAVGSGSKAAVLVEVGSGVALGIGVDFWVGFGLGWVVLRGLAVAAGLGFGLAVGFGVGFGVGVGVGAGVGVGVGVGVGGGGALTTTRDGLTCVWSQLPPPLRARKTYPHDPMGRLRVPVKMTPPVQSDPVGARSDQLPWTRTRTQVGAVPVVSETVTAKVKVVLGVPVPGETVPSSMVSVPQVRARTGDAKPVRDAVNQPASAIAPTSQVRRSCRRPFGSELPSYLSART